MCDDQSIAPAMVASHLIQISMKHETTLYEALEVSPSASPLVIKAAYRCLAQLNHPDKNAGATVASERLAQINYAYSVLANPDKRLRYDRMMELHSAAIDRRGSGTPPGGPRKLTATDRQVSRLFVFRPLA